MHDYYEGLFPWIRTPNSMDIDEGVVLNWWNPMDTVKRLDIPDYRFPYEGIPLNSICLLYTSPSPRDATLSRMPSSA